MAKQVTIVKKTANGAALLSDGTVRTPVCRLAFVHVAEPWSGTGGEEGDSKGTAKFGVTALFAKGEDLSILKIAAARAKKEKWADKTPPRYSDGIRKQDDKSEKYDGFVDGAFFMNVTSKFKPQIVSPSPTRPMEASDIYSGCYARLNLNVFAWGGEKKHKGNNGVSFGLLKVQFIRDGEPLSGGSAAEEVFDDEEDNTEGGGADDGIDDDDLIG